MSTGWELLELGLVIRGSLKMAPKTNPVIADGESHRTIEMRWSQRNGKNADRYPGTEELFTPRNHWPGDRRLGTSRLSGLWPSQCPLPPRGHVRHGCDYQRRPDTTDDHEGMMPKMRLKKQKFRCTVCGAPGIFLTAQGLKCRQDVLDTSIEPADGHKWIPVLVKRSHRAPLRSHRRNRIG